MDFSVVFFLFCLVHVPIVGCVLAGYIPAPFMISFCIIFPLFDSFCMVFPCFVMCSFALKSPVSITGPSCLACIICVLKFLYIVLTFCLFFIFLWAVEVAHCYCAVLCFYFDPLYFFIFFCILFHFCYVLFIIIAIPPPCLFCLCLIIHLYPSILGALSGSSMVSCRHTISGL